MPEQFLTDLCRQRRLENAGVVDGHIDLAERLFRGVEKAADIVRFGDIGLDGSRFAVAPPQFRNQRIRLLRAAGVIDRNGKTIPGRPLRNCRAGDDRDFLHFRRKDTLTSFTLPGCRDRSG